MAPASRPLHTRRAVRLVAGLSAVLLATTGIAACGKSGDKTDSSAAGETTTITIEGPNQWNDSGSSFGKPWENLIAAFEKQEPTIKVKTSVLPLKTFGQTISTQLSAGTAPELVFNQATFQPYMVHHLDDEMKQPNPYVPGNKAWVDLFNPTYFGTDHASSVDGEGHLNWVPFNLVGIAVFYNQDAFAKAGVTAPVKTFSDLISTCQKLTTAGYTPFAMENSDIGVSWSAAAIAYQMLAPKYDSLNVYDAAGKAGTSPQLTTKDWTKAVLTGAVKTTDPEVSETLRLTKLFFDSCVTKNWSGITGNSGALVGIRDFSTAKAAMTWGTDFASDTLSDVKFKYGTMPFPTVMKDSSPASQDVPAQWGVSTGGTSYMIPAKITGAKLAAAVKFLQFVSAPEHIETWLSETGAVPAVSGVKTTDANAGYLSGDWGKPAVVGSIPAGPPGTTLVGLYDGYLLGAKTLPQQQEYLQGLWNKWAAYNVTTNKWQSETWAKGVK